MSLTKKEIKTRKPRSIFTIVGQVIKITDSAILLARSNTQTQYWIDINGRTTLPREQEIIECDVSISSYIDRKDEVFRHKLRFLNHRVLPTVPDQESNTFFYRGIGKTEIVDIITSSEIKGLHLLKIKSLDTNEIFYARYYQTEENEEPFVGTAQIDFNISSLTSVIGTDGCAYENKYTAKWKDSEGKLIVKTRWTWYPTLIASHIFKIGDSYAHGAGGDTESI